MPEESEGMPEKARVVAPRFLEIIRKNGDSVYLNLFAVASITVPNSDSDTTIKMLDGSEEIAIGDQRDVLLNLMGDLSVFVDRED